MKDYLLELVSAVEGDNKKLNIMREYLQSYILRILFEKKFFQHCAFVGGTALRFIHELPRFSQDLDFSLVNDKDFSFYDLAEFLKKKLSSSGYMVNLKSSKEKTVLSAMIKFRQLLFEAGLSPLEARNFSVKIEIDSNPPQGANLENKIINKYFPLSFTAYNLSSLFAGKIHALLTRKYTKGRDFFDLGWYLSKWENINPNIELLSNALKQTNWESDFPTLDNWRDFLYKVVEKTNWDLVKKDVENFLERSLDLKIFNKENILKLIKR
jgi:predicted nucleotidyltransferase component of viral defense system